MKVNLQKPLGTSQVTENGCFSIRNGKDDVQDGGVQGVEHVWREGKDQEFSCGEI